MPAPEFNADAWLSACEPPRFTLGGATYVGRVLSAPEAERLLGRLIDVEHEEVSDEEVLNRVHDLVRAMFPESEQPPRRWPYFWRLPPKPISVIDLFVALPIVAQLEAIQSFSHSLALALQAPGMMRNTFAAMDASLAGAKATPRSSDDSPSHFKWPPSYHAMASTPSETSAGPPLTT